MLRGVWVLCISLVLMVRSAQTLLKHTKSHSHLRYNQSSVTEHSTNARNDEKGYLISPQTNFTYCFVHTILHKLSSTDK